MSEPDYRAMLMAMMEAYERHACGACCGIEIPPEVETWWEEDPALNRLRIAKRRQELTESAQRGLMEAQAKAKDAEEEAEAWRRVQRDPVEFIAQNVAGAEAKAAQAAAHANRIKAWLKTLADEASATAAPQAADPASVVADLEATIPHPIPHESPKEG